jgi:hemolysin activation/secretion protein
MAALLLMSSLATAQTAPAAEMTAPDKPVFAIRGFDVTGENPLSSADTTRVLAPFLRADASMDTLQKATSALEALLKERGYALHRVVLPPQGVGDAVNLKIVKFVIGKVSVTGLARFDAANIRASVPELAEGQAPNFKTLAVQTAIANESQGKQMQIALKESDEADQIDATIEVKEAQPWHFATSLNNTGSKATGHDRLTLSGSHSNVWDKDHQFTGAVTTSIERPAEVQQIGLNYRVPFYSAGGVLGMSYTQSSVIGNFGAFNSTGSGQTFGINYNHYLAPNAGFRDYLSVSLDDKLFKAATISSGGVSTVVGVDRRSRPLTLGYNARVDSQTAAWGYSAELIANLPGGDGNTLAAYQTEDPLRIDTVNFKVLRASANYLSLTPGGWLWSTRGQLQISPDALISGEQFGIGGASSVRGTGERPVSGDQGLFATLEVSTPELTPGLRLSSFVDAGWVNTNNTTLSARVPFNQLASVGLGLRFAKGTLSFSLDYARLVTGSVQAGPALPDEPKAGDDKLHLSLTARF